MSFLKKYMKLDADGYFNVIYMLVLSTVSGFLIYKIMQEHVAFYGYELFSNLVYAEDSNSNGEYSIWFKIFFIFYLFCVSSIILLLKNFKNFSIFAIISGIVYYSLWINFDVQEYRKEALLNKYNTFLNLNSGFENTENGKIMLSAVNEIDIDKFTKIYAKKLDNIKVNEENHKETLNSIKELNNNDLNTIYDLYLKDNYLSLKENEKLKKEINKVKK